MFGRVPAMKPRAPGEKRVTTTTRKTRTTTVDGQQRSFVESHSTKDHKGRVVSRAPDLTGALARLRRYLGALLAGHEESVAAQPRGRTGSSDGGDRGAKSGRHAEAGDAPDG